MYNQQEYLTTSQAANFLNISSAKVIYKAKKGDYPGVLQEIKTRIFLIPRILIPVPVGDEKEIQLKMIFARFVSKDILTEKQRNNVFNRKN